jgi:hypothetical protein
VKGWHPLRTQSTCGQKQTLIAGSDCDGADGGGFASILLHVANCEYRTSFPATSGKSRLRGRNCRGDIL